MLGMSLDEIAAARPKKSNDDVKGRGRARGGGGGGAFDGSCNICGEEGHKARDCPAGEKKGGGKGKGKGSAGREQGGKRAERQRVVQPYSQHDNRVEASNDAEATEYGSFSFSEFLSPHVYATPQESVRRKPFL